MKRRAEIKFKQLLVIIISWTAAAFIITAYDYLVLHTQSSMGPSTDYSFFYSLALNTGAALTGAILGGSFLVFFVNVKYQDKPYGYTILAVSISFILIIILIAFIVAVIYKPLKAGHPLADAFAEMDFRNFIFDNARTLKNGIVWFCVVALTQLFLQMNSKFGHGVFWNILRGKYNTPKEEKRIFMSLDLNSSTTIAEMLGDKKYHRFLKDFFADITNPVLDNKGEIYQYVGDEVVIAWRYEEGISNNHCVKCFFDMKESIEKKKEKYIKRYGLIPSFKAGIHSGEVVVGEVGIIKRDITYSGDVMNTTSRIRNKCKEFQVEIIASAELLKALSTGNPALWKNDYITRNLGAIKLTGKEKEVMLSALVPSGGSGNI